MPGKMLSPKALIRVAAFCFELFSVSRIFDQLTQKTQAAEDSSSGETGDEW